MPFLPGLSDHPQVDLAALRDFGISHLLSHNYLEVVDRFASNMLPSSSLGPSRRVCRSLQCSWSAVIRSQSTSAGQQDSSHSVAASSSSSSASKTSESTIEGDFPYSNNRRLLGSKELSLARAISLYHQSIDFPDFLPDPPVVPRTDKSAPTILPRIPPRLHGYVYNKLHREPLKPLEIVVSRPPEPRNVAAQRDEHAYLDEGGERATLSLAQNVKQVDKKKWVSKKWDALSPIASRESRTRARKMMDALLGTVDARNPGLRMVQEVCKMNRESPAQRHARLEAESR